ncbi:amidohydrolase 2 [Sulfolobus islandicus L.S.2.15]|uniref:Amidohydrolase 2 n=1 Tax=Saccharolobus islandicus (strain L.S.2.15 / Lassen \|nr:amidohydrolase family protein [Sulfolobus islandicus]ACP34859.1 amidohydrolase 2 [Sulfolobus islandicus L.S.2.15]
MGYVDSHVHIWVEEILSEEMKRRISGIAKNAENRTNVNDVIKEMDEANLDYVVNIVYPSREMWGSNEEIVIRAIDFFRKYSDRFSIVGGVQVNHLSESETKYWIERQYEAGVSGFKIHPPHMWLKPNAYRQEEGGLKQLEILYEFAQDHKMPIIIHTGTSYFPFARNKYGDPVFADDLSVDFPKLSIILAHAGRPIWVNTAFQLTRIRRNIYLDLSSIPPRKVLEYLPRLEEIKDKCLYGSDYPDIGVKGIKENLLEFLHMQISKEAMDKIVQINPKNFFKPLSYTR